MFFCYPNFVIIKAKNIFNLPISDTFLRMREFNLLLLR